MKRCSVLLLPVLLGIFAVGVDFVGKKFAEEK